MSCPITSLDEIPNTNFNHQHLAENASYGVRGVGRRLLRDLAWWDKPEWHLVHQRFRASEYTCNFLVYCISAAPVTPTESNWMHRKNDNVESENFCCRDIKDCQVIDQYSIRGLYGCD